MAWSQYLGLDNHLIRRLERSLAFKVFKTEARTKVAKQFFGNRVVNDWNLFLDDVISAPAIPTFKERLMRTLPSGTRVSLPT